MTGERAPELERVRQTSRNSIGGNPKGKRGKDMKTFKKVLASALAAAMVVTAFPVANAEAATAPKLSATKATLYVGQSKTITVKNVAKGSKVTATSSNKKAATVSVKGTKVTVKSVKKGTATVNVKVTPKKGAAKKLTAKITVKTPTVKFTDSVTEAKIATPVKVKATATPAVSVKYYSADKSIATVGLTSGTVTGKKEGTVKVAAVIKTGTKTTKVYKEIAVVNAITAKAVTPKKIAVTFAGAVEKVDKANFSVVDDKNSASFIKSVTLDESKKVATVELYTTLTSGKTYKVAVKNGEKTLEATLDYVKGSVAKIEAADQYVLAGTAQPIVYTVYDENGLDITEETDVAIDSTVAVDGNNKITLANGVFAYATVVYTNPTNGAQVKSAQFKITGTTTLAKSIDAIAVSSSTIATWPTKDVNTSTSVGNTSDKLYVQYTDIWGTKHITNAGATSLNPEVLIVDAKDNSLKPVKAGTATVNVKIGEVEKTFTVTVKDAAKISSIALDASSKTTTSLTQKNGAPTPATAVINVLDQYGAKIAGNVTITATKNNGVVVPRNNALTTTTSAGATFEFIPVATGTANFKATVSDAGKVVSTIYFAISVTAADNTMSAIKFNGVKTNFDLNTAAPKAGYATTSAVTISAVNKAGEAIDLDRTAPANATVLSDAVVTLTNNETKAVTPLGTTDGNGGNLGSLNVASNLPSVGTYTLSVVKNGIAIDSIQITVIDSAEKPAVELKTNYISGKTVIALTTDLITVPNDVTFVGVTFDSNNSNVVASVTTASAANITVGTGTATLYNVKATVTKNSRTFVINLGTVTVTR
ncbi:MAG: hypothetical protein MR945_08105 [Agathobacter sp.]|nr:hypothetical protein [Agathobacter sp.]